MRIVFVGAVDFSRHCLNEVVKANGNVVAVITLRNDGKNLHSDFADLAKLAESYGIPVYQVRKICSPANIELTRSLRPDVVFVFGWSQLISKELLDIPRLGCIGTHPALLPRNRGRHPLIWALVEGLQESGLTFFYIDEGTDSGDILWQERFPINIEDDAADLYVRIKGLASDAIAEFLPQLASGTAPRVPQDHSQATYWRKRNEKDGEINWEAPTVQTYNLVRALAHPYVGAHTFVAGRRARIWRAALPAESPSVGMDDCKPGMVMTSSQEGVNVRTGDGYLRILEYSVEGGTRLETAVTLGGCSCAS